MQLTDVDAMSVGLASVVALLAPPRLRRPGSPTRTGAARLESSTAARHHGE